MTDRVSHRPTLDRSSAIFGGYWKAIVPFKALSQYKRVRQLVGRDVVFIDHLWSDLTFLIQREQRVVDEVAVIAGDVSVGPDRVEDFDIGMHDDAQRFLRGGSRKGSAIQRQYGKYHCQQVFQRSHGVSIFQLYSSTVGTGAAATAADQFLWAHHSNKS